MSKGSLTGFIAALAVLAMGMARAADSVSLIPQPQSIELTGGHFTADATAQIHLSESGSIAGKFLGRVVWDRTAFRLEVRHRSSADYLMWLSPGGVRPDGLDRAKAALAAAPDCPEAYGLVIAEDGLAAAANGPAGLLYAAATAAQLLSPEGGRPSWPYCEISDWPDLSLRAVHLDLKHHMEKPEYLSALVPRLASFKINGLMIELEDKFLYTRRSEVAAPVGLCADDLQALTDHCRSYNIELIPLVQGLAHASYILKHPEHAELREQADSFDDFCPLHDGTYEVLFDLYEEVVAATAGTEYFHLGGDEARGMGACPRCSEALRTNAMTRFQLYETWLKRASSHILELGRTPMVWDDMLIREAGDDLSVLPEELYYVRWSYSADAAARNERRLQQYADSGLRVIVAASTQTANPYVPVYMSEHFPNIEGWARSVARHGLRGMITTAWEDAGPHVELFWPGYAASAEAAWNSRSSLDMDYMEKFARVFHGDDTGKIAAAYALLGSRVREAYSLLTARSTYIIDQLTPLPPLVPAPEGARWRDAQQERIETSNRLFEELGSTARVLTDKIAGGRLRNVYALEVLLSANRMMLSRVSVFRALAAAELMIEEAHEAFIAGRKQIAAELLAGAACGIRDALAQAESALTSLEAVWTRTRYPQDMTIFETPERPYTHDYSNYRHLASRTRDLSFYVLAERGISAREMADELMRASQELPEADKWPFLPADR